ncbi:hypothetical protein BH23ACT4_BH23ACT4_08000 [soil metagenome]
MRAESYPRNSVIGYEIRTVKVSGELDMAPTDDLKAA